MVSCKFRLFGVGPEFYAAFFEGLAQNTVMECLFIEDDLAIPLELYQALSTALFLNATLERLALKGRKIPKGSCEALALGLAANSSLVSRTIITDEEDECTGVVEIVKAAQTNKKLMDIRLSCGDHDQQIVALNGLAGNTNLKTLTFRLNSPVHGVNEGSSDSLFAAAAKIYGLEDLQVHCDTEIKTRLDIILRLNRAGRRYLVEKNERSLGVEVLTRVSDDLDCIFTHLLENPAVFCDLGRDRASVCGTKCRLQLTI
jgi:hypothetical protein